MNKYAKLKLNRLYEAFFNNLIEIIEPNAEEPQDRAFEIENWILEEQSNGESQAGTCSADLNSLTEKIKEKAEEERELKDSIRELELQNEKLESYIDELETARGAFEDEELEIDLENANLELLQANEENAERKQEIQDLQREIDVLEQENRQEREQYDDVEKVSDSHPEVHAEELAVIEECGKLLELDDVSADEVGIQIKKFIETELELRDAGIFITFADYDQLNRISDEYLTLRAEMNSTQHSIENTVSSLDPQHMEGFITELEENSQELTEKLERVEEENLALKSRVSEVEEINIKYEQELSKKGVFRRENIREIELETRLREQEILIQELQDKLRTERGSRISEFRDSEIELQGDKAIQSVDEIQADLDEMKKLYRKVSDELLESEEEFRLAEARTKEIEEQLRLERTKYELQQNSLTNCQSPRIISTDQHMSEDLENNTSDAFAAPVSEENTNINQVEALSNGIKDLDDSEAEVNQELENENTELTNAEKMIEQLLNNTSELEEKYAEILLQFKEKQLDFEKLQHDNEIILSEENSKIDELEKAEKTIDLMKSQLLENENNTPCSQTDEQLFLIKQLNEQLTQENDVYKKEIKKLRSKVKNANTINAEHEELVEVLEELEHAKEELAAYELELEDQLKYIAKLEADAALLRQSETEAKSNAEELYIAREQLENSERMLADATRTSERLREEVNEAEGSDQGVEELNSLRNEILAANQRESQLQERLRHTELFYDAEQSKLRAEMDSERENYEERIGCLTTQITSQEAEIDDRLGVPCLSKPEPSEIQPLSAVEPQITDKSRLINSFIPQTNLEEELIFIKSAISVLKTRESSESVYIIELINQTQEQVCAEISKTLRSPAGAELIEARLLESKLASNLQDERLQNEMLALALDNRLENEDVYELESRIQFLEEQNSAEQHRLLGLEKRLVTTNKAIEVARAHMRAISAIKNVLSQCRREISEFVGFEVLLGGFNYAIATVTAAAAVSQKTDEATQIGSLVSQIDAKMQTCPEMPHLAAEFVQPVAMVASGLVLSVKSAKNAVLRLFKLDFTEEAAQKLIMGMHGVMYQRDRALLQLNELKTSNNELQSTLNRCKVDAQNTIDEVSATQAGIISRITGNEASLITITGILNETSTKLEEAIAVESVMQSKQKRVAEACSACCVLFGQLAEVKRQLSIISQIVREESILDISPVCNAVATFSSYQTISLEEVETLKEQENCVKQRIEELSSRVLDENLRYNSLKEAYETTKIQLEMAERREHSERRLRVEDLNPKVLSTDQHIYELKLEEKKLENSLTAVERSAYAEIDQKFDFSILRRVLCTSDIALAVLRAVFNSELSSQMLMFQKRGLSAFSREIALASRKMGLYRDVSLETQVRMELADEILEFLASLVQAGGHRRQ